jgi:phospholipid/cholesterol/gamma-HCH transport system permease protein
MGLRKKKLFDKHTLADAGLIPAADKPPFMPAVVVGLVGSIGILLGRTGSQMVTARVDRGESWRMAHRFLNESVTFVVIAMAFVGMIMVYQSTEQLARAVGDTQLVGASFLKLLVRVLGPTVIGLLIACRVGAGIAAELGAMAVTDQLDAMRMCAAEPVEVLMVPRLRGGIIASLALAIIGSGASMLAGLLTGMILFGTSPGTYWNLDLIETSDVAQGLAKALVYGIAVPIVSGAVGLAARGGARGVGQATTDAVVGSSFAIVVLDSLISLIAHVFAGSGV